MDDRVHRAVERQREEPEVLAPDLAALDRGVAEVPDVPHQQFAERDPLLLDRRAGADHLDERDPGPPQVGHDGPQVRVDGRGDPLADRPVRGPAQRVPGAPDRQLDQLSVDREQHGFLVLELVVEVPGGHFRLCTQAFHGGGRIAFGPEEFERGSQQPLPARGLPLLDRPSGITAYGGFPHHTFCRYPVPDPGHPIHPSARA